ncbi:hypothetical protein [Verrucomicrobium spinosum]|uniref:hypothetical protein n=1 Tax=Verrucomicrobium spinosum TaxID=2736 RepID=UPI000A5C7531|nr:hypothetical protein [Verrucomicrobium spinosum]
MKNEPQEDVFSEKLDLKLWGRVFRHALPYKKLLTPLAIAAVGIALCDASFALITRWTVDAVAQQQQVNLWPYATVYFVAALALSVASGCSSMRRAGSPTT